MGCPDYLEGFNNDSLGISNSSDCYFCCADIDIVCEDADGDGYFYWGIKDSTFTLPLWAPQEEDGDDSDASIKKRIDCIFEEGKNNRVKKKH